jgi:hypothetical protein
VLGLGSEGDKEKVPYVRIKSTIGHMAELYIRKMRIKYWKMAKRIDSNLWYGSCAVEVFDNEPLSRPLKKDAYYKPLVHRLKFAAYGEVFRCSELELWVPGNNILTSDQLALKGQSHMLGLRSPYYGINESPLLFISAQ